jgi:hypothetical protein
VIDVEDRDADRHADRRRAEVVLPDRQHVEELGGRALLWRVGVVLASRPGGVWVKMPDSSGPKTTGTAIAGSVVPGWIGALWLAG